MKFKPIELEDKDLMNKYLKTGRVESSELTFAALFIWRKAFNMEFAEIENCLVIKSKDNGYPASLRFPMGNGDKKVAVEKSCKYFLEIGEVPKFYGLTKDMVDELIRICPDKFRCEPMRDYFDYVYKSENLIKLSGKKLHSKKNHFNNFQKSYEFEYSPITMGDADMIIKEYNDWSDFDDEYLLSEQKSIEELLLNFDYLELKGAKIMCKGQLCAFTIGEQLNSDTAVIHIEKANTKFRGAFAAINQMFIANEWSDYAYINREEDCGIEGLRTAKLSYQPEFMVEKYKAVYYG